MSSAAKTRILDSALALFNEQGSGAVSTNHIAEAIGMSPGNLYYHYRNKPEIVRALFDAIAAEWAALYALRDHEIPGLAAVERMFAGNFDVQWRYRFFFRELPALLQADAELAAIYRANREQGFGGMRALMAQFAQAGIVSVPDEPTLDRVADLLWLIGDNWLTYCEIGGDTDRASVARRGVALFWQVLNPYIVGDAK